LFDKQKGDFLNHSV